MFESDIPLDAMLCDVIVDGQWSWPGQLHERIGFLADSPPPRLIVGGQDRLEWQPHHGTSFPFSVHRAWRVIREYAPTVPWSRWVWYSQSIPRHSFIVWLAIRGRLRTHDVMVAWGTDMVMECPFCHATPDSHDHLFFTCDYPSRVWQHFQQMSRMENLPGRWTELVTRIGSLPVSRRVWSIVQRLTFGAVVYYVWQERNLRLFQEKTRPVDELCGIIRETIRTRLFGLRFAPSPQLLDVSLIWDLDFGATTPTRTL